LLDCSSAEAALKHDRRRRIDTPTFAWPVWTGCNCSITKAVDSAAGYRMTAYSSVDSAIAALRKGAYDYVTRPFVNEDPQRVRNAPASVSAKKTGLRRIDKRYGFAEIIGTSSAASFPDGRKVAGTNANI
jgi:DNA-binding NtrC family response regulator